MGYRVENIYEQLCVRDPRNPMHSLIYSPEDPVLPPRVNCSCDCCFKGLDELAMEILRLRKRVQWR